MVKTMSVFEFLIASEILISERLENAFAFSGLKSQKVRKEHFLSLN
jgi:hypothetical protein